MIGLTPNDIANSTFQDVTLNTFPNPFPRHEGPAEMGQQRTATASASAPRLFVGVCLHHHTKDRFITSPSRDFVVPKHLSKRDSRSGTADSTLGISEAHPK